MLHSPKLQCCIVTTIYLYMRKHSQHNNDERTHFFKKIYLSHLFRNGCQRATKGLCVRVELETQQTATYWPPVTSSLAALLSRSAGLLNQGSWGPIAFCWVLVLSPASYLPLDWHQLTDLPVAPVYILVWRTPVSVASCTQFNPSTVKVIPWYLPPDAPVPWSMAESEVNTLHQDCRLTARYSLPSYPGELLAGGLIP